MLTLLSEAQQSKAAIHAPHHCSSVQGFCHWQILADETSPILSPSTAWGSYIANVAAKSTHQAHTKHTPCHCSVLLATFSGGDPHSVATWYRGGVTSQIVCQHIHASPYGVDAGAATNCSAPAVATLPGVRGAPCFDHSCPRLQRGHTWQPGPGSTASTHCTR